MRKLLGLRDERGDPLLRGNPLSIILAVARFPMDKGNFQNIDSFRESLPWGKIDERTVREGTKYLLDIQVMEMRDGARKLRAPGQGAMLESLCSYRSRKKVPAYAYRWNTGETMKTSQNDNLFLDKDADNLSETDGQFIRSPRIIYPSYKETTSDPDITEILNNNHPIVPPRKQTESQPELDGAASRPRLAGLNGRPNSEGLRPRASGKVLPSIQNNNNNNDNDNDEGERIVKPKRKGAGNLDEYRMEALNLIGQGHIANPLGRTLSRGRRLKPNLARPIGEKGSVTIAQLWRAYTEIYHAAFGIPDALEAQLQPTRENITRFFDDMRQRFVDTCGVNPDYRDMYEYLKWFHDTSRLQKLLAGTGKSLVHPNQLLGKVHVRRFYDEVLRHKGRGDDLLSDKLKREKKITSFIQEAFDSFRKLDEDDVRPVQVVMQMVKYGVVLFAEYLHDYKGLQAPAIKQRMIRIVAEFLGNSHNQAKGAEFAAKAMETSRKSPNIRSTLWDEWEVALKDVVPMALEMAGKKEKNGA